MLFVLPLKSHRHSAPRESCILQASFTTISRYLGAKIRKSLESNSLLDEKLEINGDLFGRQPEKCLFVIPYPDVVAGRGEWIPGDVEPAIAREQLVGVFADLQEFDELPELRWIFRTDVGSLAEKVLGITDTPYLLVDFRIAEA